MNPHRIITTLTSTGTQTSSVTTDVFEVIPGGEVLRIRTSTDTSRREHQINAEAAVWLGGWIDVCQLHVGTEGPNTADFRKKAHDDVRRAAIEILKHTRG